MREETNLDDVLSRLVEVVLAASNEHDDGSPIRIPPEREIAQTLGIQRSTLREGLATLTHLGMLQRTRGRGTFLSLPKSDFLQLYFNVALAVGYLSIDDLEIAREMLERAIVRRAVLSADARDIFELEELARRMETSPDAEEQIEADFEFHHRLARATKNRVIELLMDGLSNVLRRVLHRRRFKVRSVDQQAKQQNATHMPIAAAIAARDVDAAVAAMDRHFSVWSDLSKRAAVKPAPRSRPAPAGRPTAPRARKTPVR